MRTYIVTGASSDIGTAFLKALDRDISESAEVYCQYHSSDIALQTLQKQCSWLKLHAAQCDLSSPADTDRWVNALKDSGVVPTHILHLAAQRVSYMRIRQFDWEKTAGELNIQVNAFAQLLKSFLPLMAKNKYGRVCAMLTSYTIGVPPKFMCDYIITKYALLGLVKSAASEYAGTGVTVNGLSPSMIETKFLTNIDTRVVEMTAQQCPMKRNVTVDEVVHGLMFLLSDGAGYMNGVNLNLSGGEQMQS